MPVREYSGAAKATTLTGAVSAGATVINVVDATGWPTGAVGPFVITIDAGVTTEEKVLCSGRTGNSLSVSARGFDGTTASDHGNAASVQHTLSATDIREANAHVNDVSGDPHPQYVTPADGAALYSSLAHGHDYAPTTHSHTYESITLKPARQVVMGFRWSGLVSNNVGNEYNILPMFVPAGLTLTRAYHQLRAGGPVAVRVLRNDVLIPGWGTSPSDPGVTANSPISVKNFPGTFEGPDVVLAAGDKLTLLTTFVGAGSYDLVFDLVFDVAV